MRAATIVLLFISTTIVQGNPGGINVLNSVQDTLTALTMRLERGCRSIACDNVSLSWNPYAYTNYTSMWFFVFGINSMRVRAYGCPTEPDLMDNIAGGSLAVKVELLVDQSIYCGHHVGYKWQITSGVFSPAGANSLATNLILLNNIICD